MSAPKSVLPAGYEELEPFAENWAVAGAANRARLRHERNEAEREAFYKATMPRLADALAFLDKKPVSQLDEKEQRLMNMLLSLAHISLAVEVHRDEEDKHASVRKYLRVTTAPSDHPYA